jgi:hypothetical protein
MSAASTLIHSQSLDSTFAMPLHHPEFPTILQILYHLHAKILWISFLRLTRLTALSTIIQMLKMLSTILQMMNSHGLPTFCIHI